MKSLRKINSRDIPFFIDNLWESDDFKCLSKTHCFFEFLKKSLQKAPLWVYDESNVRQRYHLTSFFRFLCTRTYYENKYIQDLYYFHELVHCSQYLASEDQISFEKWSLKLSKNELMASLYSECFIYLLYPELQKKTFKNLWILEKLEVGPSPLDLDLKKDWFIEESWPFQFRFLLQERLKLRGLEQHCGSSTESEKLIISYNKKHIEWLSKWASHYQEIEKHLYGLTTGKISDSFFENYIISKLDKYDRPFGREIFELC